ncbi:hypothetical protein [Verrucosispora sp. WMMD573]|uniref:hypothetical protein n=1 Tax=Verrucosispora sp. WMMD573 TaxID=3015149 RepID=UPI00248B08A9|nr:hypothetical protein [Verrucosispora sp. WMMD573]WBB53459.1 hypothetical protein O7601_23265 [Verrucosispora sp. WMMD573]
MTARNVGGSSLLLNGTIDATVTGRGIFCASEPGGGAVNLTISNITLRNSSINRC